MTSPVPEYGGCPWPIDPACLADDWALLDPDVQARSIMLASSTLTRLTGYRVGGCPITVRPCKRSCANTVIPYYTAHAWMNPHIAANGMWVNSCGCTTDCSCTELCEITLPGPVGGVTEVKVDGTVVPDTDYRVDGQRLVWIGTGACLWPVCQNLAAADDQPGTFSVTYLNSYPVDALGAYAAGVLANEFAKACTGSKACRLPSNVAAVTRQGVSFDLTPGTFPDGFTGIREIDAYVSLWNPKPIRQAPQVWSPDLHQPRVVN